ncbi:hypothetical protein GOBAR_DD32015 [Gossypium barbadense]|nr:hypothetical protein GOBAR_DD32015 [Gossypium barbadense]
MVQIRSKLKDRTTLNACTTVEDQKEILPTFKMLHSSQSLLYSSRREPARMPTARLYWYTRERGNGHCKVAECSGTIWATRQLL